MRFGLLHHCRKADIKYLGFARAGRGRVCPGREEPSLPWKKSSWINPSPMLRNER